MRGERAVHYLLLIIFAAGPGIINFCIKFSVNIFTEDDEVLSLILVMVILVLTADAGKALVHSSRTLTAHWAKITL